MQVKSFSSHSFLSLLVLGITLIGSFVNSTVPETILKDPRFLTCMSETNGPDDPNFMSVFAKCYSFAGRPRFGKRSLGGGEEFDTYDNTHYPEAY